MIKLLNCWNLLEFLMELVHPLKFTTLITAVASSLIVRSTVLANSGNNYTDNTRTSYSSFQVVINKIELLEFLNSWHCNIRTISTLTTAAQSVTAYCRFFFNYWNSLNSQCLFDWHRRR